jgi:hypothetical protein
VPLSLVIFLGAALITVSVTFLIVRRMVNQLKQIAAPERRISSIFLDLLRIISEHNRLFPKSGLLLAFWLSLIYLAIWLAGMVLSLATDFGDL